MQVISTISGSDMKSTARNMDEKGPESTVPIKRPRTSEDFLLFCKFILEHENYEALRREEKLRNRSCSPRSSGENRTEGSKPERVRTTTRNRSAVSARSQKKAAAVSQKVESPQRGESSSSSTESDTEGEGFHEVTCYCGKPYAGRPMIECSKCLTWLHLSCARVKRTNIPDEYICTRCREPDSEPSEGSSRGSSSSRSTRNKPGDL